MQGQRAFLSCRVGFCGRTVAAGSGWRLSRLGLRLLGAIVSRFIAQCCALDVRHSRPKHRPSSRCALLRSTAAVHGDRFACFPQTRRRTLHSLGCVLVARTLGARFFLSLLCLLVLLRSVQSPYRTRPCSSSRRGSRPSAQQRKTPSIRRPPARSLLTEDTDRATSTTAFAATGVAAALAVKA